MDVPDTNHSTAEDEPVYRVRVWPSGMLEGMMKPEAVPFVLNTARNLFRDAAACAERSPTAPVWLAAEFARLRDEMVALQSRLDAS